MRCVRWSGIISSGGIMNSTGIEHSETLTQLGKMPAAREKRVLNAGSGPPTSRQLHRVFRCRAWREVRLDIDPQTEPDVVGSITDMSAVLPAASFDAVWSSHSLEHLHRHEVPAALKEFRRVLRPDGFALVTSPDLETVAAYLLQHGPDHIVYTSPMGPITAHDMLFGHARSIALGKSFMAHNTGFTCASLGRLLLEAGFPVVLVKRDSLSLWALALMEEADKRAVQHELEAADLDMFDEVE
jgi:SAM-dependent methyltransferase